MSRTRVIERQRKGSDVIFVVVRLSIRWSIQQQQQRQHNFQSLSYKTNNDSQQLSSTQPDDIGRVSYTRHRAEEEKAVLSPFEFLSILIRRGSWMRKPKRGGKWERDSSLSLSLFLSRSRFKSKRSLCPFSSSFWRYREVRFHSCK